VSLSAWFSICPACGKPLGPWTLGATALCGGHEKPVAIDIDYPDQQRHFRPTQRQLVARQRREQKRAKGART
jgi:hypothetical protein